MHENKVLLAHSHAHVLTNCPWLVWGYIIEMGSCERDRMARKPEIVTIRLFTERV